MDVDAGTIAIVGVGVALLAAILGVWRDVKSEVRTLRTEMRAELSEVRIELHTLAERVARIEGRLDERDRHVPS